MCSYYLRSSNIFFILLERNIVKTNYLFKNMYLQSEMFLYKAKSSEKSLPWTLKFAHKIPEVKIKSASLNYFIF